MSHAKPADERGGHRAAPVELAGARLVAPALPDTLRKLPAELADRWVAVWESPVAAVLDPVSDLEPMSRLFKLYHRGRQLDDAFERQLGWLEAGDVDMPFDPQFARVMLGIASEIRQLEQTLGITPRGRLVIGAAVLAAGKAAADSSNGGSHDDAED